MSSRWSGEVGAARRRGLPGGLDWARAWLERLLSPGCEGAGGSALPWSRAPRPVPARVESGPVLEIPIEGRGGQVRIVE
jgi:hypothetical protein